MGRGRPRENTPVFNVNLKITADNMISFNSPSLVCTLRLQTPTLMIWLRLVSVRLSTIVGVGEAGTWECVHDTEKEMKGQRKRARGSKAEKGRVQDTLRDRRGVLLRGRGEEGHLYNGRMLPSTQSIRPMSASPTSV